MSDEPQEYQGPNVERRRMAYTWFIILAIVTFVVALVDILFLDNLLMYGVFAALGVLFLLAIIFLFARGEPKDEEEELEPLALEGSEHLHCPHCAHVFALETPKNTKNWKRKVAFTCPECGNKGILPPANATPLEAVVPGGEVVTKNFRCGVCNEGWSVGVIGHRLKKKPKFDACPSCNSAADIRMV